MSRLILRTALLFSLSLSAAWAGVVMGGAGPPAKLVPREAGRLQVAGILKAVRWTSFTGRAVIVPAGGPAAGPWRVVAPAGEWVEVTLIFDGPVWLGDDAGRGVKAELGALTLPLAWPVSGGGAVALGLDLDAPQDLWSGAPLSVETLVKRLEMAGVAWVDSASYSD